MDDSTRADLRARLEAMLAELDRADTQTAEDRKPVELDQQSVGRLSRIDAMQMQAMAEAQAGRRAAERKRIRAALARFEEDEYGHCQRCGEEIEAERLRIDPAAPFCVDCARA
jgi:DnaK suppressor protein